MIFCLACRHWSLAAAVLIVAGSLASRSPAAPPAAPSPRPVLEEVERQRAQFASPAAGTSFDDAEAFADALRRIVSEQPEPPVARAPALAVGEPPAANHVRARYVSALRDAARLFDAAASDLEEIEAYRDADELRERAAQLRLGARQLLGAAPIAKPQP